MEPAQSPLHHPPVHPEAATMGFTSLSQHRHDVQPTQCLPQWTRVVGSVTEKLLGPLSWSTPLAFQWRYRLYRGMAWVTSCTLAPVKRTARGTPWASVTIWCLLPALARSVGLGPVRSPQNCPYGSAVHHCSAPIQPVGSLQAFQTAQMYPLPDPGYLPQRLHRHHRFRRDPGWPDRLLDHTGVPGGDPK